MGEFVEQDRLHLFGRQRYHSANWKQDHGLEPARQNRHAYDC